MSVCVLRVAGDIVNQPVAFNKLKKFPELQNTPGILVVSSISEISETITKALNKVLSGSHLTESIEKVLTEIWHRLTGISVSGEYSRQSVYLANLLQGIQLIGDCSPALKDSVLSCSEDLSALILIAGLKGSGWNGVIKRPSELKLMVSPDPGNATFLSLQNRDLANFAEGEVWIVPGSYGITRVGKITRCGKSAADYTAAFLTSELSASKLVIWASDVRFRSADPQVVPGAEEIARLTYAEASELAYFDQCPIHPRTVEPLVKKHIPIHLINPYNESFDPETVINSEDYISPGIVKGVASTNDLCILKLNGPGVGLNPGILAKITGKLTESAINIKSVITSQVSINILLDKDSGLAAVKAADESGVAAVNEIELLTDVSLIAIVGTGMQQNYGISATLFGAVARNKINVLLSGSGASDLVSYLVVSSADAEMSVKAIHQAFFNTEN